MRFYTPVTPAKAGVSGEYVQGHEMPACAGMTCGVNIHD
jgi:hypothetical protein